MEGKRGRDLPDSRDDLQFVVMDVDLEPSQPDAVAMAVDSLLAAEERPPVDAWWAEGQAEALES